MNAQLLQAIQHYNARAAITSSSMRGARPSTVKSARKFLGQMSLAPFGSSSETQFLSRLNRATEELKEALPKGSQRWGLARKGLNIFLRNCLYTTYLRDEYGLARAERFFEIPLDSITGTSLVEKSPETLPPWTTVRGLTAQKSAKYQAAADELAAAQGYARVHLDAVWWGEREGDVS